MRHLALRTLVGLAALASIAGIAGRVDAAGSIRAEIQRALKPKSPAERASALGNVLEGQDSAEAAEAVWSLVVAREDAQIVLDVGIRALGRMKDAAATTLLAKAAAGGRLEQRVRAVEALGRSASNPGGGGAASLLPLLTDPDLAVRAAAATALGRSPDDRFAPNVQDLLRDPEFVVRSAAIGSLGRMRAAKSVPALCEAMRAESGRLIDDATAALRAITGQRFGPDANRYLRWYAAQNKLELPGPPAWIAPPPSFASPAVATRSRRILFVLSTAETMKDPVNGAADEESVVADVRAAGTDLAKDLAESKSKLDVARVHLRTMLRTLRDGVAFDVCVYSGSPTFAFGRFVDADADSRRKAEARVASLSPGGPANLHGALVRAFDPHGKDPFAPGEGPDTIVLLTDGALAAPGSEDVVEVAGSIARWNAVRQIRIVAVGVGQSQDDLLGRLAAGPPEGVNGHVP